MVTPTASLPTTPTVILSAPGGISGAIGTNFFLDSRAVLSMNGGTQLLIAASGSDVINWVGNLSNAWDVHTTQNWTNQGSADVYYNPDKVTFTDNAATFTVSVVPLGVSPASVTFTNATHDYTIGGGAIGGNATVSFNGTRTVTITNDNTYAGGTTINSGTVVLGDGTSSTGSLGSGSVTNNAALVTNYGPAGGTLANAISGTGSLSKIGSGTLTVSGSNTYTGATNINAGTLQLTLNATLGTGNVVNSAALVTTASTTLPNTISGAGSFTHTAGTVVLTGNNTYTGGSTINAGATLSIGNGGASGNLASDVANSGALVLNRSDNFTFSPAITGAGTLIKQGTGVATLSSATLGLRSVEVGTNTNGGTLSFAAGSNPSLGDGSGVLNVGFSPNTNATGALDASAASSFTANFATINVGVVGNNNSVSVAKMLLPANSTITAGTAFLVGDSAGARNQQDDAAGANIRLTTAAGGTTTVRTPSFQVARSKTSASLALGAGNTFDLAGTGTTPRAAMGVGNMTTGGGAGFYYGNADFSAGIFKGNLSSLFIADQANNSGATSSALFDTMTLSTDSANHIDVSGPAVGLTPAKAGVVVVGRQREAVSAGFYAGTVTIGNLDAASAITVTNDAGNAIGSGNAILVAGVVGDPIFASGQVELNGGTLTITTTGSAIAGGGGTSAVNFNGMTLKAGASSSNWINNLTNANVAERGIRIDSNGFTVTVPQALAHGGSSEPDGGFTKSGAGTVVLTGNNNYSGVTTVKGGRLELAVAAQGPALNGAGGADVQAGRLIFDYGGTSIAPTIKGMLAASYANGFASGQIRSSTADSSRGLGWLDDGSSKVTVGYTYFGDTDLSGTVDLTDFTFLAANFNGTGKNWSQGDFNYDGSVDLTDFTYLAGNFNKSLAPDAAPTTTAAGALGAPVPEPGAVSLCLAGCGALASHRHRHRR